MAVPLTRSLPRLVLMIPSLSIPWAVIFALAVNSVDLISKSKLFASTPTKIPKPKSPLRVEVPIRRSAPLKVLTWENLGLKIVAPGSTTSARLVKLTLLKFKLSIIATIHG